MHHDTQTNNNIHRIYKIVWHSFISPSLSTALLVAHSRNDHGKQKFENKLELFVLCVNCCFPSIFAQTLKLYLTQYGLLGLTKLLSKGSIGVCVFVSECVCQIGIDHYWRLNSFKISFAASKLMMNICSNKLISTSPLST